jgi:hypothetical protein
MPTRLSADKRLEDFVRAQLAIDRTGIVRRPAPARAKGAAWAIIIGAYLVGWWDGNVAAFKIALGLVPVPDHRPVGTVEGEVGALVSAVAAVLVASAGIWAFRQYANATPAVARWGTSIKAFFLGNFAVFVGFAIAAGISGIFSLPENRLELPPQVDPLLNTLDVINSGMAGPAEELALLALVVVALRATGHSWAMVIATAIVLRVPFHLYYGWGAVGLSVWAALMVPLYRRTNAIVAILLAHAVFNTLSYGGDVALLVKGLLPLIGAGIAIASVGKGVGRGRSAKQAAPS